MSKSPKPVDPDNDGEADLPDDWVSTKSEALKEVLYEMTSVYNEENKPIEVRFAEVSHADKHGEYIAINPYFWQEVDPPVSGPNILRVLTELESHEVGHYNWSELDGKEAFGEMYPGWGQIPGHVANILEDEFVDAEKMRQFYGLRSKRAYRMKLTVDTDQFYPDVEEVWKEQGKPNAFVIALHQTALCGAVKGIEKCPDELAEFCALVEPIIERYRTQHDSHERMKLNHVVMQILIRYLDEPEDFDDDAFEDGPGKTISGDASDAPDPEDVDPEDAMPEHMEEMIKEFMEELAADDDIPGDPDSGGILAVIEDPEIASDADETGGEGGEVESEAGADGDDVSSGSEADFGGPESAVEIKMSSGDADSGPEAPDTGDETGDGGSDAGSPGDDDTADGDGDGETGAESGDDADDTVEGDEPPDIDTAEDVSKPDEAHPDAPPATHDIEGGEALHEIDDRADELSERDPFEGIEERYEVRLDEIEKADDRDRARWASLVKSIRDYDLEIEERKRDRNDRIERFQSRYETDSRRMHLGLKRRAEDAGVIRELKEGFEELVSRPLPEPARRGTRIDPINISRRAAGDITITELFEDEKIVETGERCVGLATDISGSMGSAIDELKIAGAAIGKATDIIGDEFVWEAFTDQSCSDDEPYPECRLDLRVVTGPDEQFEWEHVDSFMASRNEPTAAGVRDCFNLMQQTDANEYVMIVITDGVALVEEDGKLNRGGNEPVEHARQAVNQIRAQGVDVIGLGIGSMDERKMEETFGGNNYRLTNIDNLAQDILELYKEQMEVVKQR
jgi:hypothetical protein